MPVVIAIDAGTTGVRSFALRDDGTPAGYAYREFPQHFPAPGLVEHDPDDIWEATTATLADLLERLDGETVAAVGITNQRETTVVWDRRTGRPLHRALVWQDRRTAARCDALAEAGTSTRCAGPPAWSSIPTSRPRSWSGCSRRVVSRPGPTSPSARSTAGSCGT
jgi:glycerol kinase